MSRPSTAQYLDPEVDSLRERVQSLSVENQQLQTDNDLLFDELRRIKVDRLGEKQDGSQSGSNDHLSVKPTQRSISTQSDVIPELRPREFSDTAAQAGKGQVSCSDQATDTDTNAEAGTGSTETQVNIRAAPQTNPG